MCPQWDVGQWSCRLCHVKWTYLCPNCRDVKRLKLAQGCFLGQQDGDVALCLAQKRPQPRSCAGAAGVLWAAPGAEVWVAKGRKVWSPCRIHTWPHTGVFAFAKTVWKTFVRTTYFGVFESQLCFFAIIAKILTNFLLNFPELFAL